MCVNMCVDGDQRLTLITIPLECNCSQMLKFHIRHLQEKEMVTCPMMLRVIWSKTSVQRPELHYSNENMVFCPSPVFLPGFWLLQVAHPSHHLSAFVFILNTFYSGTCKLSHSPSLVSWPLHIKAKVYVLHKRKHCRGVCKSGMSACCDFQLQHGHLLWKTQRWREWNRVCRRHWRSKAKYKCWPLRASSVQSNTVPISKDYKEALQWNLFNKLTVTEQYPMTHSMLRPESQVALKTFSADEDGTKSVSYMPEKHCCTPSSQELLKYV